MKAFDKIVLVTWKTRLARLVERFNSRGQARFYIEHAGGDFNDYVREDDSYQRARERILKTVPGDLKMQELPRDLLSTFLITPRDVVVTLGGNGLVVNTAKYVGEQPIVAVNPEPARFDTVLLPYRAEQVPATLDQLLLGRTHERRVSMAQVTTGDGQVLRAFNDVFVGCRTHGSARYRLREERQSSSGIIISTGAGSSGWLSSCFNMAASLAAAFGGQAPAPMHLSWDDRRLVYVVREPFVKRGVSARDTAGVVGEGETLEIESLMPSEGVVFTDGVESDFVAFNAGTVLRISCTAHQAHLVWPP
ncbi:MAG TPA: NAD+ kinase [Candidatus Xenobia bacterium]|jgi:hypothetical protein